MNSKNRIGAKSKNRLQELLGDQLANWEGLFNEIENECNDDEIDLKFRGRKIDYERSSRNIGNTMQEMLSFISVVKK